jgi:orotate phosphoribosyltransferase
MESKKQLGAKIKQVALINGEFTLRSGKTTSEYFDKYRFESDPSILSEVTKEMVALIPAGTEILAGLEMGGIPVVTMLSHYSGLPAVFVRKKAKGYGTSLLAEGATIDGKNVLVVEDVVTTGGQIVISTGELRGLGAKIASALCVIDREEGGVENLAKDNVRLLSLLRKSDM